MARATKERLQRDAVRFGLGQGISSPAVETRTVARVARDAEPCGSCGRTIGEHSLSDLIACGKKLYGVTP